CGAADGHRIPPEPKGPGVEVRKRAQKLLGTCREVCSPAGSSHDINGSVQHAVCSVVGVPHLVRRENPVWAHCIRAHMLRHQDASAEYRAVLFDLSVGPQKSLADDAVGEVEKARDKKLEEVA